VERGGIGGLEGHRGHAYAGGNRDRVMVADELVDADHEAAESVWGAVRPVDHPHVGGRGEAVRGPGRQVGDRHAEPHARRVCADEPLERGPGRLPRAVAGRQREDDEEWPATTRAHRRCRRYRFVGAERPS
jgi:hypothetical protein